MINNLLINRLLCIIKPFVPGFIIVRYRRLSHFRQIRKLLRYLQRSPSIKIIVGASATSQPHWISTEESYLNLLKPEDWDRFFKKRKIDIILAEHVWEHLSIDEAKIAAKTCYAYLKHAGKLRVAVPDGLCPDKNYQSWVTPPSLGHKVLFNYQSLAHVFEKAGFKVRLLEYYDEDGEFHYNHWSASDGLILRSLRFDPQNRSNVKVISSVIIDAVK